MARSRAANCGSAESLKERTRWPYLWIDATYMKARRQDGRVVLSRRHAGDHGDHAELPRPGTRSVVLYVWHCRKCSGRQTKATPAPGNIAEAVSFRSADEDSGAPF